MTYRPINTKHELPKYRKDVLFWFPGSGRNRGYWDIGSLRQGQDKNGDFFHGHQVAWYLCDGNTTWAELPPEPEMTP